MLEEIGLGGSSDDDTVENARFIPSVDRLQAFDPEGDQRENNDQLALAVDGDASTAWRTETYKTRADFGGLKPGVGIIVDLAEFMTISGVEIETATPGITVSLLSADEPADSLSGWNEREAPTQIEGEATIEFESVESRYLLMWLTGDLPPADEGAWRAEINELAVLTPSG
jgi:putative peptidoglycan lipid II flippase